MITVRASVCLLLALLLALPAASQPVPAAPHAASVNAEVDILPEAVVIYSDGKGPAWWKVTKGDSTVFILGLPPSKTLPGLKWDRTTLRRRLKGARMMLAPFTEGSGFLPGSQPLRLDDPMASRVRSALIRLGERHKPDSPMTVESALHIRGLYANRYSLTRRVHDQIYSEARSARVPIVTPPAYYHEWDAAELRPEDPEIAACFDAMIKDSEVPPSQIKKASEYWAVGDVGNAIATAPTPFNNVCHRFWPGHVERTIGFQTNAIAQSLDKPGKVIAVVYLYQLLDRNGILERLRARGFTIADPAKPLTE